MRIVVVGPGALGCLFAARLTMLPSCEVCLLDHDKKRSAQISSKGITLIEAGRELSLKVRVVEHPGEIKQPDFILLCVKSHDVPSALEQIKGLASADNLLIALQNGISHHRIIQEGYRGLWAIGVTAQGAALEGPGVVRHGGNGETIVGFIKSGFASPLLNDIALTFNDAGIQTVVSTDIQVQVWRKFIINVGINALSVIFNCPNGQIIDFPDGRERLAKAVNEAVLVAGAKGIDVGRDLVHITEKVCRSTSINISSMLQDVRRHKKTEINAINGALVHEAKLLGISVPENERLVQELEVIESQYLSSDLYK